jgi:DNA polymerase III sliding clamp (beta) subunit (PCNA family)
MSAVATGAQVSRAGLAVALAAVRGIIPSGPAILSADKAVLLRGGPDGFSVKASNREAWVWMQVEGEGDVDCMVDHAQFSNLLRNLSSETLVLETEAGGLRVRWGRSAGALLPILPTDLFPFAPQPDGETTACTLKAEEMAALLGQTAYAAAFGTERTIAMRCVHLSIQANKIAAYGMGGGAKGSLGAYASMEILDGVACEISIPQGLVRAAIGFLAAMGEAEAEVVTAGEDQGYVILRSGSNEMLVRTLPSEHAFPLDVTNRVLAQVFTPLGDFTCSRDVFTRALKVVQGSTPLSGRVSLILGESVLSVQAQNPETGATAEEEVPLASVGRDVHGRLDFNVSYVLGALEKIPTEEVRIRYVPAGAGAAFTAPDSDAEIHMIGGLSTPT